MSLNIGDCIGAIRIFGWQGYGSCTVNRNLPDEKTIQLLESPEQGLTNNFEI